MNKRIRIYEIQYEYIQYLSLYQKHIFSHKDGKSNRKYIGIVVEINGMKYFAPLSSYKDKHKKMRETVDFIKIKDYAVININTMVPVPEGQYWLADIDSVKEPQYKAILHAELREIKKLENRIRKNAEIVYTHKLRYGNSTLLAKRTNDFKKLEELCKEYG